MLGFAGSGCGWLKKAWELITVCQASGKSGRRAFLTSRDSSPVCFQIYKVPSGQRVRGKSHNCVLLLALWCLASFLAGEINT